VTELRQRQPRERDNKHLDYIGRRFGEFEGVKMTLTQAVFLSGHKEATVWGRLKLGWTVERALTVPLLRRRS
jgi:hypothetical protein